VNDPYFGDIDRGFASLDALVTGLGWDPAAGLQLVDAVGLARRHHPDIDPSRPALVRGLQDAEQARAVAQALANQYPAQHPLTLLVEAQSGGQKSAGFTLHPANLVDLELVLAKLRSTISGPAFLLAVPPLPFAGSMLDLAEVIAHLRAPDGCPWDRAQSHESLRPYLLEEAYEAVEAIDRGNLPALAEELGDVLLQVVLHAQIAVEAGSFSLPDVIRAITEKLLRRHPHVFGEVEAATPEAVLANWEQLKRAERAEEGLADGPLAGVPLALPALARAELVLKKIERIPELAGLIPVFDRPAFLDQLDAAARAASDSRREDRDGAFGEALLMLVALARKLGMDPETALRERVTRFVAGTEAKPA
jgi:tetrapyrrole methylase family protein/MazG family protein